MVDIWPWSVTTDKHSRQGTTLCILSNIGSRNLLSIPTRSTLPPTDRFFLSKRCVFLRDHMSPDPLRLCGSHTLSRARPSPGPWMTPPSVDIRRLKMDYQFGVPLALHSLGNYTRRGNRNGQDRLHPLNGNIVSYLQVLLRRHLLWKTGSLRWQNVICSSHDAGRWTEDFIDRGDNMRYRRGTQASI